MTAPTRVLNDGVRIPAIGLGTNSLRGAAGSDAIRSALECGFRLIDSAVNGRNEVEVGRSVREFLRDSGTPRDEVFVQVKVPNHLHDEDQAIQACEDSLALLGLDRIDVLLLHAPNYMTGTYLGAWRAFVELQRTGVVRCIGVSNFTVQTLAEIIRDSGVPPAVHQLELHPRNAQGRMHAEDLRLGIVTQAWSPRGSDVRQFPAEPVAQAAEAHRVAADQVVLRWHLQLGNLPLPMSISPSEQRQHLDLFGFELSEAEMTAISALSPQDSRPIAGEPVPDHPA